MKKRNRDKLFLFFMHSSMQRKYAAKAAHGGLVLHPVRNHTRGLPSLHHCVVKISRRCHRIAVEILPSTDTNHAAHKFNF